MRLRTVLPPLPNDLLDALEDLGIKTDADLLFSGDAVDLWRKLPDDSITLQEVADLMTRVAAQQAAPMMRGDVLLQDETERCEKRASDALYSGVQALDELVGGFGQYRVLEISGDGCSGKTALALQIVLRYLSGCANSSAVWIDTTGDFSADRVHQIMRDDGSLEALERLQVSLAFELEAVQGVLESAQYSLNLEPKANIRCIVIDSITPLFRPLLSVVSSQGHSLMTTFMRRLREFAEMYSLTILIINSTSKASPRNPDSVFAFTNRKPALGPSFTFLTDATLWLSRIERPSQDSDTLHVAEVLRSRRASHRWCPFRILDGVLIPFR